MSYEIHITAGPAYMFEEHWDSLSELIEWAKSEYVGNQLGYLQDDRSYKNYDIDSIYIMEEDSDSEDPVWSWYKN